MADTPPTTYVLECIGAGNVQVWPLFGTQVLGTQIGSDVGTGGPALATLETRATSYNHSRVIEFLDDVYCLVGEGVASNTIGVYKRNQGGSGAWGRVHTPSDGMETKSGMHIMYPNDVPTLVFLSQGFTDFDIYLHTSTDGTTWNETKIINDSNELDGGYSCVYRNAIFYMTKADVYRYDFDTNLGTRLTAAGQSPNYSGGPFHVHNNVLYAMWVNTGIPGAHCKLFRYQAGAFTEIYNWISATPAGSAGTGGCLFTDYASGELIALTNLGATSVGTSFWIVNNPEGTASTTNITSTVLGVVEGAAIYAPGGGSASSSRKWQIMVDNDSDPTNPRTYLWTWTAGGGARVWQWQNTGAEIQSVTLTTIAGDNFVRYSGTRGGGNYFVTSGAPRAELGDAVNIPTEVFGGTKWYFRLYGTGGPVTLRLYYNSSELAPSNLATLTGSVTIESGSPSTIPARSGNTITNLTADDGATLYSFVHAASSDGLAEGDTYTLMADVS